MFYSPPLPFRFLLLAASLISSIACFSQTAMAKDTLIFGLSQKQVSITPNFSGTEIIVYGAIERSYINPAVKNMPVDIIVTLSSLPKSVTVRKKTKVHNIWTNTQAINNVFAPMYYAIASTSPLKDILSNADTTLYSIGMQNVIYIPNFSNLSTLDVNSFKEALIRLRQRAGLYRQSASGVTVTGNTLFQTRLQMPENIVSGDYRVRVFLVKDQKVQDVMTSDIYVRKAGLERVLYELAHDKPLQYGILCIILAAIFGLLAFQIFSIGRR